VLFIENDNRVDIEQLLQPDNAIVTLFASRRYAPRQKSAPMYALQVKQMLGARCAGEFYLNIIY